MEELVHHVLGSSQGDSHLYSFDLSTAWCRAEVENFTCHRKLPDCQSLGPKPGLSAVHDALHYLYPQLLLHSQQAT